MEKGEEKLVAAEERIDTHGGFRCISRGVRFKLQIRGFRQMHESPSPAQQRHALDLTLRDPT